MAVLPVLLEHLIIFLFLPQVFCNIPFKYNLEKHFKLSECLMKIARDQVKTKRIVFVAEDFQEENNIESIIKMKWDRVIVPSTNVSKVSGIYVFIPNSNTTLSYEKILKAKHLDYNSLYIICTDSMQKIFSFFEDAWEYKIIDAIALYPSSTTEKISVYTYIPYGDWGCSNTEPIRINIYDPQKKAFDFTTNVFTKKDKLFNLHKCPVKVTLKDASSEEIKQYDGREFNKMSMRLFNFLQMKMNFTPDIVFVDKEANTYAAAYYNFTSAPVLYIVHGDSDIAVGRFSQLIDYHEDILSPVQTGMDCFTWAVPVKAGTEPSVWTTSLFEFDYPTWILVIVTFVLTAFTMKLIIKLTKNNYTNSTLTVYGIILSISVNMKFQSTPMRVFVSHWLLFCLVLFAAYSASLGSLVTVPPDSSNIKSTFELLEKDITLTGDPKMYHILSASSETSAQIKRVLDKFVILRPGEFDQILHEIYKNRNKAVFYTKSKLMQEENRMSLEHKIDNLIHIVPVCLITSHTSPLILRKGSVLMDPVKEIVVRLLESGLIGYWTYLEEEGTKPESTERTVQKFTLSQLRGALIVIVCGHAISSGVFLYEIYSNKLKVVELHNQKEKLKFLK